jgi:hypothetical protein
MEFSISILPFKQMTAIALEARRKNRDARNGSIVSIREFLHR